MPAVALVIASRFKGIRHTYVAEKSSETLNFILDAWMIYSVITIDKTNFRLPCYECTCQVFLTTKMLQFNSV